MYRTRGCELGDDRPDIVASLTESSLQLIIWAEVIGFEVKTDTAF